MNTASLILLAFLYGVGFGYYTEAISRSWFAKEPRNYSVEKLIAWYIAGWFAIIVLSTLWPVLLAGNLFVAFMNRRAVK